jgi:hypothetical protein
METNFEEISSKVEVVKIAMTQDKNGYVLKLALNPADAPEDLLRDMVGQRYLAVFVRVNEQDEPVASMEQEEGKKAVALAGTLCADENFQRYLMSENEIDDMTESAASTWLRRYLDIASRKELRIDRSAREKLYGLRTEFVAYLRNGGLLR